MNINNLQIF